MYRSLVKRGWLRVTEEGWAITQEGRNVLNSQIPGGLPKKRRARVEGQPKLRYRVSRTAQGGWVVIDTSIAKIRMHNDVVERYRSREAARIRARELNYSLQHGEPAQ